MEDRPDDVPALSDIGDGDDLPGYWTESTTITVDRWVKQALDDPRNNQPWNQYLMELQRAKNDPLTLSDVDDIAERLGDQLDASGTVDARIVDMDAAEQRALAEAVAEVLQG